MDSFRIAWNDLGSTNRLSHGASIPCGAKIVAYVASRSSCNTRPCKSVARITVDSAVATKGSN